MQSIQDFQFLDGTCSDEVYQDQVQTCPQGFVGDQVLKNKIQEAASRIFAKLRLSDKMLRCDSTELSHDGLKFEVFCAYRGHDEDKLDATVINPARSEPPTSVSHQSHTQENLIVQVA